MDIWFRLVSSQGKPYIRGMADMVYLPSSAVVHEFRNAVKAEYPNALSLVHASQLSVYVNKDAFVKNRNYPLSPHHLLKGHGKTKEEALFVVAEDVVLAYPTTSSQRITE